MIRYIATLTGHDLAIALKNKTLYLILFIPLFVFMVLTLVDGSVQVAEEKEKKLLLRLLQTPIREVEWLLAKVLYGIILIGSAALFLQLLTRLQFGLGGSPGLPDGPASGRILFQRFRTIRNPCTAWHRFFPDVSFIAPHSDPRAGGKSGRFSADLSGAHRGRPVFLTHDASLDKKAMVDVKITSFRHPPRDRSRRRLLRHRRSLSCCHQ